MQKFPSLYNVITDYEKGATEILCQRGIVKYAGNTQILIKEIENRLKNKERILELLCNM